MKCETHFRPHDNADGNECGWREEQPLLQRFSLLAMQRDPAAGFGDGNSVIEAAADD